MIVSLDWEKPCHSSRGRGQLCSLCRTLGAEGSRAELAGTTERLLLLCPALGLTKMQDTGGKNL